jgi:homogentisate 1,2-dioxygenase
MAPFSERDIRRPERLEPHDEAGDFPVIVKSGNRLVEMVLPHHPFDVVGWDGYYYPWALSIHDFEPRVGRVHLPPPVHQTFEGDGFVICSFCPRPFDFEKDAVSAPYSHQNVMSDEVLFYANDEFMSRKGIELGSITLHPDGLPHGPQPGKTEESIGATGTTELAVMVDTFRPLWWRARPSRSRTRRTSARGCRRRRDAGRGAGAPRGPRRLRRALSAGGARHGRGGYRIRALAARARGLHAGALRRARRPARRAGPCGRSRAS